MKIMLDVGHGGKDSGAVANGLRESQCNLQVALAARDELRRLLPGAEVRLTRSDDRDLTPEERLALVRGFNPDICVSIHHNSAGSTSARGAEIFHAHFDDRDDPLAQAIMSRLVATGIPSRGAKTKLNGHRDYYYMIGSVTDSDTIAVLVEGAFLTNVQDAAMVKAGWLQQQGKAIAAGIVDYAGPRTRAPADPLTVALSKLQAAGVISSPDYWAQHAKAGDTCKGDYVAALIYQDGREALIGRR